MLSYIIQCRLTASSISGISIWGMSQFLETILQNIDGLDPAEGTWSAAPSLATARAAHTATLLSNGKLLLVGGFSTSAPTATTEIYW